MENEGKKEPASILVVDANPESREYLQAILEGGKYSLELAESGREGLEKARINPPKAMILSLALPDMDGAEVCLALRSEPSTSRIVIFILGEHGDQKRARRALEVGADDYLVKPFRGQELELRLDARFRHRSSSWRPEEQEALLDLTRLLASSLDMSQLLHLVAVRTAELLQVDRCSMVLVNPASNKATVVAASEDAALSNISVALDNYPEIQEVIRTRRPFVVERVEKQPTLQKILPTLISKGVGSLALFPMMHEDHVDGVLFLRSERFGRILGERDIFFANAVAAAVALALRNLQAVENERRITSELKSTKSFWG